MSRVSKIYAGVCGEQRREQQRAAEQAELVRRQERQAELDRALAKRQANEERLRRHCYQEDALRNQWQEWRDKLATKAVERPVPKGADVVSSRVDIFGRCEPRYGDRSAAKIIVPEGWVEWDVANKRTAPHELLVEKGGWRVIWGLDGERPENHTGGQLVLPLGGKLLVPPVGTFELNLPTQVQFGAVTLGPDWVDIYFLLWRYLAYPDEYKPEYFHRDSWSFITLPNDDGSREKWWWHNSLAGLQRVLELIYNGEATATHRLDRSGYPIGVVALRVPQEDAGLWIGAGGSQAQRVANAIGVERIQVIPV